jgi:hypothetical protein
MYDDLAEHLPVLQARETGLELGEPDLGVDHRQDAVRHLGEGGADICHTAAE